MPQGVFYEAAVLKACKIRRIFTNRFAIFLKRLHKGICRQFRLFGFFCSFFLFHLFQIDGKKNAAIKHINFFYGRKKCEIRILAFIDRLHNSTSSSIHFKGKNAVLHRNYDNIFSSREKIRVLYRKFKT